MSAEEVTAKVSRARAAQEQWAQTTFEQRREVLRVLLDFVVDNQEALCRVASRDTGKTSEKIGRGKKMEIGCREIDTERKNGGEEKK